MEDLAPENGNSGVVLKEQVYMYFFLFCHPSACYNMVT